MIDEITNEINKICKKCNTVKLLTDFNINKKTKDGRQNVCKACFNEQAKTYYISNKKTIIKKVLDRRRSKNNKL